MLKKRITLLDTDENFSSLVSSIIRISGQYEVVSIYQDCHEALKKLKDDFTEILLMDLDFADMKGTEFIQRVREKVPGLEILVTTHHEDDAIVFATLIHGASGYLLKKNCLPNLLEALAVLTAGGSPLDPMVTRQLIHSLRVSEISPLSPRESVVLKLMMQGKRYSTIAQELFISRETVKTHLKNIYRKLKVNSKTEAVRKAIAAQLVTGHFGYHFNN